MVAFPVFPIVRLISNRFRAPRRILRVSMKLAINILMHERGSFGARARARGPIRYEAPRTLGSLSLDPEEPDRFEEQPLLRFFGCHSSVDTLGALRSARCPLLRSSSFDFCSLRTGSANCGGRRRTPEDVLPACLPACLPFPFTPLHPSLSCGIWESMPARSRPRSAINLGVEGERDDKSVRSPRFRA